MSPRRFAKRILKNDKLIISKPKNPVKGFSVLGGKSLLILCDVMDSMLLDHHRQNRYVIFDGFLLIGV
jgi:hypothetical protein